MCCCKDFHNDRAELFHANFNQRLKKLSPQGNEKFIQIMFLYAHLNCTGFFMYENVCQCTVQTLIDCILALFNLYVSSMS